MPRMNHDSRHDSKCLPAKSTKTSLLLNANIYFRAQTTTSPPPMQCPFLSAKENVFVLLLVALASMVQIGRDLGQLQAGLPKYSTRAQSLHVSVMLQLISGRLAGSPALSIKKRCQTLQVSFHLLCLLRITRQDAEFPSSRIVVACISIPAQSKPS